MKSDEAASVSVRRRAQEDDLEPLLEVKTEPELETKYEYSERTSQEVEAVKSEVKDELLHDIKTEIKSELGLDGDDVKHSPEEYFEHEKVQDRDIKVKEEQGEDTMELNALIGHHMATNPAFSLTSPLDVLQDGLNDSQDSSGSFCWSF